MKKSGLAIVAGLLGGVTGAALVGKLSQQVMEDKDKRIDKFKSYYNMLNQWLCIRQQGGSLADYFKKKIISILQFMVWAKWEAAFLMN